MRTYFGLVALLAALTACGDSGGNDNQNTSQCPAGHEPSGPACVPIFDDCPGAAEIPVLGGGCQQVGVTACATGLFESDGAGGCEPILPDHACPPGTMEMLGQTGCQPVGVTQCAAGFESDGEGGCDAILPPGPDPCPSGTIALLGHTTCQPLGDCGTGTWGNIVDDGTTVYVDQTADATGADGSLLAPFVTISAALTAVAPGGQIAVAAGDYTERLAPGAPVRLTGRCAELVTIRGRIFVSTPRPPLTLLSSASGSTIRGVTLTGPGEGLLISGAQQVVLSQVQVRDASAIGINLDSDAEADLQRVVVAGCAETGILSSGSALRVEESVVRDTRPTRGTGRYGRGIEVMCSTSGVCGSLLVSASLVSGNRDVGILSSGHDSEVTASVVRDTLPEESSGAFGRGISAMCDSGSGGCGSLRVSSSVVSRNRGTGIIVFDVDTEVTGTVVRDTLADEITGGGGQGFYASCSTPGACVGLRISSSLVSGNRDTGIIVFGVNTEVTATVVRDTLARESTGEAGQGIWTQCSSAGVCGGLRVSSSLVSGNRDGGVVAFGVEVEVTDSVVRDTLPSQSARDLGQGIWAQCASTEVCGSLLVSSSVVSGNRTTGISMAGVDTEVTS
ncbi:MAG: right-handed parallel beta-helix repeat-containing protein, partial [bacterium]